MVWPLPTDDDFKIDHNVQILHPARRTAIEKGGGLLVELKLTVKIFLIWKCHS